MICPRARCAARAVARRKDPMNSVGKIAREKLVAWKLVPRRFARESPS